MGGFDVIDPRYGPALAAAQRVLGADPRVLRVEVGGSVGASTADAWSDLDLVVVATDDGFESLVAEWPEWMARITPTVFAATPVAPSLINTVTADGLPFDVAVHRGVVFDFPRPDSWFIGGVLHPTLDAVLTHSVAELLRCLCGPFVSSMQRGDHLRNLTVGVPHLLGLLGGVFLAELDAPMPTKQWSAVLTAEQQAAAAALPAVRADRDSMLAFGLALAELIVTRARPEMARRGLAWPTAFAAATTDRLRDALGVDSRGWLH
jgi:hypothetical protein